MSTEEQNIKEVIRLLTIWITDIELSNALSYYDINRTSEGTCMQLLNLIYGYELQDLNIVNKNYPGIDLGDYKLKFAIQVTSQNNLRKIKHTLKQFKEKNFIESFPSGVKMLILTKDKKIKIKKGDFLDYTNFFNPDCDILYLENIVHSITQLYRSDQTKFFEVKTILMREFGNVEPEHISSLIGFPDINRKIEFYISLYKNNHSESSSHFIPFRCSLNGSNIVTTSIEEEMSTCDGVIIWGKSGCGKSALAKKLSLHFLDDGGIPIFLESKYYETDLNALLDKEAKNLNFESGRMLMWACEKFEKRVLIIVDGLNECSGGLRNKLIGEIEEVKKQNKAKCLITAQVLDNTLQNTNFSTISIESPDSEVKKAIAKLYCSEDTVIRLEPILEIVGTSLEAAIIGKIGSIGVAKISRFSLFDLFVRKKLVKHTASGMLLLSYMARLMSEKISFSTSLREIEKILRVHNISEEAYTACIHSGLIVQNVSKVSFTHEMFFNFFIADSIARFSKSSSIIISELNAPKNFDKKLMIIGSIENNNVLIEVLDSIQDSNLLLQFLDGEGGDFCKTWADKKITYLLPKVEAEVRGLKFYIHADNNHPIQFLESSLFSWTEQERAFAYTIPSLLLDGKFLNEIFYIIQLMDNVCSENFKELLPEAKEKGINIRSNIFSTAYAIQIYNESTLSSILSSFHSGAARPRGKREISGEVLSALLNKKSLKHGQFFFLLLLCKYNKNVTFLYPYVINALKNHWKSLPYHLRNEILYFVHHYADVEEQRLALVEALNNIHATTYDPWESTQLFDALSVLGGLHDDAVAFEPTVLKQIRGILVDPENCDFWPVASSIYHAQFDHPYDYAFTNAISNLNDKDKKTFLLMCLRGNHSSFFTTSLIMETAKFVGTDCCPYLLRWAENPLIDQRTPQDSIAVCFISNIILGKFGHSIISRYNLEGNDINKSLLACAEIYHLLNRSDLTSEQAKERCRKPMEVLFDMNSRYSIETVWQSQNSLHNSEYHSFLIQSPIISINQVFPEHIVSVCRNALESPGHQKGIFLFDRPEKVFKHAIWLLAQHGDISDIPILHKLSDDSVFGEDAIRAIKKLETQS